MATRPSRLAEGQLRLVEPSPPAEEIAPPDLTEEEDRDVKLLVNNAGYSMEDALMEVLGPGSTDGIVELTLVDSPPAPDLTAAEDALDRIPDGAGMNTHMARTKLGL